MPVRKVSGKRILESMLLRCKRKAKKFCHDHENGGDQTKTDLHFSSASYAQAIAVAKTRSSQ